MNADFYSPFNSSLLMISRLLLFWKIPVVEFHNISLYHHQEPIMVTLALRNLPLSSLDRFQNLFPSSISFPNMQMRKPVVASSQFSNNFLVWVINVCQNKYSFHMRFPNYICICFGFPIIRKFQTAVTSSFCTTWVGICYHQFSFKGGHFG